MDIVNLAFGIYTAQEVFLEKKASEQYETIYKKLVSFLYSHPELNFSFYFSGLHLQWLEKNHDEFIMILEEMTARKQIEVLGGGFYEPPFPLLLPADRIGQIEYLTTAIRRTVGKRPRGIFLPGSIWEPSLISSFTTSNLEYVLLDSSLFTTNQTKKISPYTPVLLEELGKTITIIPLNSIGITNIHNPDDFITSITKISQKNDNAIICCFFSPDQLLNLLENAWFDKLLQFLKTNTDLAVSTTPGKYLKTTTYIAKQNIGPGMSYELTQMSDTAYVKKDITSATAKNSIKDFLLLYPEAFQLYARLMYTSLLINQFRGDKSRKKTAREELWKAQNYTFLFTGTAAISNSSLRHKAYKHLILAEKIIRDPGSFLDSITSFDFDMNGLKEYVCKFPSVSYYVSLIGGTVFELDIFANSRNYLNTMPRIAAFDGVTDGYERKMFVDHLFQKSKLMDFKKGQLTGNSTLFSQLQYQEFSFNRDRKEVVLKVQALFGDKKQAVSLRKKYVFSDTSIQVQYILKNESSKPLQAFFAVESNFAMEGSQDDKQKIEVVSTSEHRDTVVSSEFEAEKGISAIQIRDLVSDISFLLQPNENAGLMIAPLMTNRPHNADVLTEYQSTVCSLFWELDISPGYETEKTILFTITLTNPKSRTRKKTVQPLTKNE